jgi:two-component system sensor histidine kinase AgrC
VVYGKCEMMAEYICYGVLYIAEATIAWLYFDALFCRKSSGLKIGITFAVAYLLLFGITWFNSVVLNGAAFFLANLLLLWMNYECKLRSAILHSAFLTSIMAITEIIAAWIISLFGFRFGAYADSLAIMIVMAVISKMLYFSITVIAAKLWAPNRQAQEEPAFMGLLCILPIFSVIVSAVVVYIGVRAEMTKPVELLMIIIVLTLLIVNLIFMVIYNHLQRMHAEQLAMNLSIQKEEADAAYYQDLQKQSENQRILIHDIKRHLNTIHGLANDFNAPGISEYITKLVDDVLPDQQVKLCSDPILNFMLQQFRDKCKSPQITFQCDIRDNCLSFMDAPSITTFYGNLLTNAFEAASFSAERTIELSVKKNEDQQVVIVSVVNSCDTPPVPDHEGLFRTKKRNPGIHGVGLKSIGRIVARYHGVATMRFDPESKKFYHIVQFPMQEERKNRS